MFQFLDAVTIKGTKTTAEGYLIADAFAVRTGTQIYAGYEVGKPELATVTVYRAENEVFHKDTLQSFSHVPVTNDHPSVPVTADNWKDFAVGETSTDILRDGEKMKIPLVLKDKSAIADIATGKRELSAGYSCQLVFEDGVAPDGTKYQAKQVNIRANHVAVVQRGRAGSDFRIGDSEPTKWGITPIHTTDRETPQMEKFVIDGITIDTTPQGAQALNKMQKLLADSVASVDKLTADHAAVINAKDTQIGELTAKLVDAEKQIATPEMIEKFAADRSVLVDLAKKIAPNLVTTGLTDSAIRRAAVAAHMGEPMVKDASDAQVEGMFKVATVDKAGDPLRANLMAADHQHQFQQVNDNGQSAYEQNVRDAWKTKPA